MSTASGDHHHVFDMWPFPCAEDTGCLTTRQIMEQGLPVLAVLHDIEGTWQVLCETTEDPDDGMIVCLGCLYERLPVIGEVAGLARGYEAVRAAVDAPWEIRPTEYAPD